jgi:single-strand DNA-binding protein
MSGINKVILVGNLGKDPEVRHLEGGTAVAKFPLATTESYKNKEGQRISQTEWHNIVVWRGLAEVAGKYLNKGMQVYIEGKIKNRSWDDKDGNKRYITEIVADNMTILGRRDDTGGATSESNTGTQTSEAQPSHANESDDLPF